MLSLIHGGLVSSRHINLTPQFPALALDYLILEALTIAASADSKIGLEIDRVVSGRMGYDLVCPTCTGVFVFERHTLDDAESRFVCDCVVNGAKMTRKGDLLAGVAKLGRHAAMLAGVRSIGARLLSYEHSPQRLVWDRSGSVGFTRLVKRSPGEVLAYNYEHLKFLRNRGELLLK